MSCTCSPFGVELTCKERAADISTGAPHHCQSHRVGIPVTLIFRVAFDFSGETFPKIHESGGDGTYTVTTDATTVYERVEFHLHSIGQSQLVDLNLAFSRPQHPDRRQ